MVCIKAELACAAVRLLTNVVYVLIFIVVAVKTRNSIVGPQVPAYEPRPPTRDIPLPESNLQNFSSLPFR